MNIDQWNNTARQSQKVADSYNHRLSTLQKEIEGHLFRCPWCGRVHPLSEAQIKKIRVGKDLINTHYDLCSSTKTKTYVKTYYNVRFCSKCIYKNNRNKFIFFTLGKIIYVIIGIALLFWLITTDEKLGFIEWLGAIVGYGMIALCALGGKDSVEENIFDTVDLEYSYKGNAIG